MGPLEIKILLDTLWTLLAAFLVFWMNAGFALVESGLARSKNTVNILAKNFIVFAIASLAFWMIGWGLMFGDGGPLIGTHGLFCLLGADNSPAVGDAYHGVYSVMNGADIPLSVKFFFQLVFAGTAATIVSGAVAERIKFISFIVFSAILVAFLYPTTGHWIWGGGWLAKLGVLDFSGSTVIHSMGGWASLAGILMLGPRIGKFKNGRAVPIPGHNMTSATLGTFILWLGWFGFNPGSTLSVIPQIGHIALTTNMAASAGLLSSTITAWILLGKPDLSMILNGTLAGLVAITAPCAFVSVTSAVVIGGIAGVLVVFSVLFFDRMQLDDPVGALSVHLANGIWGTLALGLFAQGNYYPGMTENGLFFGGGATLLWHQFVGVIAVGAFTFVASLCVWKCIKVLLGLRVTPEEEIEGLDIGEHGNSAYPDFQPASSAGLHLK